MNPAELKLLRDAFKRYYFEHSDLIRTPHSSAQREYGYQKFDSGMIRHVVIKDDRELHLLLMQEIPSDVYCSNAYYTFPGQPMKEKDWKGADLIFDIDAKDLKLPCRDGHTVSVCRECGHTSQDKRCAKCNSHRLDASSLPCKDCIDASKLQVKSLADILVKDLAVPKQNIQVYFSGNEGFHVYVTESQYEPIGSKERSELVDYMMFKGCIPETFGMKNKPDRRAFPEMDEGGWRGRFAKKVFGSKSARSKAITQLVHDGRQSFQKRLDALSDEIGIKIDPHVTTDIHRVFRLGGSLNSKSGLAKIPYNDPSSDPYSEACLLNSDPARVLACCPVQFKLGGKKFGPYNNEVVTVPTFTAAYMICKRLATIP